MKNKRVLREPLKVGEEINTGFDEVVKVLSVSRREDGRQWAWVEFQDESGHVALARADNVLDGAVRNPYRRIVAGYGYVGVGKYTSHHPKHNTIYCAWIRMLNRAYNPRVNDKGNYKVCVAWQDFQVFAEWWMNNRRSTVRNWLIVEHLGDSTYLYSPETCYLSDVKVVRRRTYKK